MTRPIAAALACLATLGSAHAQTATPSLLLGQWQVDLRPTPGAAPYLKTFEIRRIEGRRFSGSFYGAPFQQGLLNTDWGAPRIAFTTADGGTEYHHSATLRDGRLDGITHAPGRGFLAVWTATRSPSQ